MVAVACAINLSLDMRSVAIPAIVLTIVPRLSVVIFIKFIIGNVTFQGFAASFHAPQLSSAVH